MKFEVPENMIMWAFRYALGRRTGAVTDVVEFLLQNWSKLSSFTRKQIKEEIATAILMENAGDYCDIVQWQEILETKDSGEEK